jgi:ABC-type nitrate/sulfonate/bicarbonate transport system substrate-binding protein
MKMTVVQCGYLPLVDSAPLIIAKELKFAAEEGLELVLAQQPSWSALRDRLVLGQIEFAHMLSPMPIAMSLGLGGLSARIDALMVLSVNGTVVGVSETLNAAMRAGGWTNTFDDPRAVSRAIFAATEGAVRIGVPFPFSMHRMLVEYWLKRDPDYAPDRVEIVTIPPAQMADAVRDGVIDMFCVGEPWGSVAVEHSGAALVLPNAAIWQCAPEKVLGARHEWVAHNMDTCTAMVRAIYKAAVWLDDPRNMPLAVEILARSQHLDLPDHAIEPALTGQFVVQAGTDPVNADRLITFHGGAANFPWRSHERWISEHLRDWHGATDTPDHLGGFRSDVYRAALAPMGVEMPGASEKVEGAMAVATAVASTRGEMILGPDRFFDGAVFDFSPREMIKN